MVRESTNCVYCNIALSSYQVYLIKKLSSKGLSEIEFFRGTLIVKNEGEKFLSNLFLASSSSQFRLITSPPDAMHELRGFEDGHVLFNERTRGRINSIRFQFHFFHEHSERYNNDEAEEHSKTSLGIKMDNGVQPVFSSSGHYGISCYLPDNSLFSLNSLYRSI